MRGPRRPALVVITDPGPDPGERARSRCPRAAAARSAPAQPGVWGSCGARGTCVWRARASGQSTGCALFPKRTGVMRVSPRARAHAHIASQTTSKRCSLQACCTARAASSFMPLSQTAARKRRGARSSHAPCSTTLARTPCRWGLVGGGELLLRVLRSAARRSLTIVCISSLRDLADIIAAEPQLVADKVCEVAIQGGVELDGLSGEWTPDTCARARRRAAASLSRCHSCAPDTCARADRAQFCE